MIGILIIARLCSARLEKKHLIKANGKTLIEWLAERFLNAFDKQIKEGKVKIFIATSHQPENKEFEKLFKNTPLQVYYGNDSNIPLRQLECSEQFNLENIISIDGDDILCSTSAALALYDVLSKREILLAKSTGLPLGMNVIGYKKEILLPARSYGKNLETGWGRIFANQQSFDIVCGNYTDESLRFTLDYIEDADFFVSIIESLREKIFEMSDAEIINFVIQNKLFELNSAVVKQYWQNFNNQKEIEAGFN